MAERVKTIREHTVIDCCGLPSAARVQADIPTRPAIDRRGRWRRGFDGHISRESGRSD
jgi:hypothetical protein